MAVGAFFTTNPRESARFVLGRGLVANPGDEDFQGEIDEVRIWDHRRSVAQIRDTVQPMAADRDKCPNCGGALDTVRAARSASADDEYGMDG